MFWAGYFGYSVGYSVGYLKNGVGSFAGKGVLERPVFAIPRAGYFLVLALIFGDLPDRPSSNCDVGYWVFNETLGMF